MNVGPSAQIITPRFADFVAAADARRRAADASRTLSPRPVDLLPLPEISRRESAALFGAPGGYLEALEFGVDLPLPDLLERSTALSAATRTLRTLAVARGQAPAQMLGSIAATTREKLPSQNAPQAQSAFRTTLRVTTEFGHVTTVDLHVAKAPDGRWEIAVFDQAPEGAAPFPYAAPPLFVAEAQFDPLRAEFVIANMFAPPPPVSASEGDNQNALLDLRALGAALALAAICGVLFLTRQSWPLAGAAIALAGIVALRRALR